MILVRNEANNINRIDDVTIERVTLTRDEFDQSLFEYEKHKNELKSSYVDMKKNKTNSSNTAAANKEAKLKLDLTLVDLQNELFKFKLEKERRINSECERVGLLPDFKKCLFELETGQVSMGESEIVEKIILLRSELNRVLDKVSKEKERTEEASNLNEMYKWVEVEKNKKHVTAHQEDLLQDDQEIERFTRFNRQYSLFFVHYYKKNFNKFSKLYE